MNSLKGSVMGVSPLLGLFTWKGGLPRCKSGQRARFRFAAFTQWWRDLTEITNLNLPLTPKIVANSPSFILSKAEKQFFPSLRATKEVFFEWSQRNSSQTQKLDPFCKTHHSLHSGCETINAKKFPAFVKANFINNTKLPFADKGYTNQYHMKNTTDKVSLKWSPQVHSNTLSPKSDQHQISPCNINAL